MSDIDCTAFEQWLDEGAGPARAAAMREHGLACPRCAAALEAMATVDAWLATPITAPEGFTDAIMARVSHTPRVSVGPAPDDVPWWLVVLRRPAMVVAAIVAGFVTWKPEALPTAVAVATSWITRGAMLVTPHATLWSTGSPLGTASLPGALPLLAISIALAMVPLLALGALGLANWIANWVSRLTLSA